MSKAKLNEVAKAIGTHESIKPISSILSKYGTSAKGLTQGIFSNDLQKALATADRLHFTRFLGGSVDPKQLFNLAGVKDIATQMNIDAAMTPKKAYIAGTSIKYNYEPESAYNVYKDWYSSGQYGQMTNLARNVYPDIYVKPKIEQYKPVYYQQPKYTLPNHVQPSYYQPNVQNYSIPVYEPQSYSTYTPEYQETSYGSVPYVPPIPPEPYQPNYTPPYRPPVKKPPKIPLWMEGKVMGFRPMIVTDGGLVDSGRILKSYEEAAKDGMFITDSTHAKAFIIQQGLTTKDQLTQARNAKNQFKFVRKGKLFIEKSVYQKDLERNRGSNSAFNWMSMLGY